MLGIDRARYESEIAQLEYSNSEMEKHIKNLRISVGQQEKMLDPEGIKFAIEEQRYKIREHRVDISEAKSSVANHREAIRLLNL